MTLKLEVSGFPRPTIKWTRDSAPVDPDFSSLIGKDGSVTFICVEMSRSGMYHFVAKNIAGKVEGNVTLVVQSEEEETGLDRVDSKPVQLADFGEYLSGKHSTNNAGFICEFHVSEISNRSIPSHNIQVMCCEMDSRVFVACCVVVFTVQCDAHFV